jgi:hypothetical protein
VAAIARGRRCFLILFVCCAYMRAANTYGRTKTRKYDDIFGAPDMSARRQLLAHFHLHCA